ncbi:unnamed protein product [Clonostachys solani]|uniref:Uncharacterized protein n=1 Tax=Clonostachys solani TaxID=160281 RepID=A0A9N9YVE1_9HYPO|nr:unnamed protein product [Clonostachys solani]
MSLLLMIPAEIRLAIFRWTICSVNTPPSHPAEEQPIRRNLKLTVGFTNPKIKHLRPPNHTLPLLLVNRQVYEEVKAISCRLSTDYYVDIMVVKKSGLWPTWSIPVLPQTQYIDSINCTLRIFDPVPPKPLDGAPGPQSLSEIQLGHVKKLVIDILAPVETSTNESMVVGDGHDKAARKLLENHPDHDNASITPEESLARCLCEFFDKMLSFGPDGDKMGRFIYEQVVDNIAFTVNGKDFRAFELESRLREEKAKWRYETASYNGGGKRLSEKWILWVDKRRQRMREGHKIDFDQRPYSGFSL